MTATEVFGFPAANESTQLHVEGRCNLNTQARLDCGYIARTTALTHV
jgi:hypothetical protein